MGMGRDMHKPHAVLLSLLCIALAGCSDESPPECNRMIYNCAAIIKLDHYWLQPPAELYAGEAVLDVTPLDSSIVRTDFLKREPRSTWLGERETTCASRGTPFVVHKFRVNKVVRGEFLHETFVMIRGEECDGLPTDTYALPEGADRGYLVVHRSCPPEGAFPATEGLPVMAARARDITLSPETREAIEAADSCPSGPVDALQHQRATRTSS